MCRILKCLCACYLLQQISQTSLVIRLQEALEAVNLEGNFGVQGKPEEGAKYVTYSRLYSELEGGISLYLRSQAVKDIKVQINSWLIEQEIELAQLETQHINQTTLDSIRVSVSMKYTHKIIFSAVAV